MTTDLADGAEATVMGFHISTLRVSCFGCIYDEVCGSRNNDI